MKKQYINTMILIMVIMAHNTICMDENIILVGTNRFGREQALGFLTTMARRFSQMLPNSQWPTKTNNLIDNSNEKSIQEYCKDKILDDANNTRLVIDPSVIALCEKFIALKKEKGSDNEIKLYENMTAPQFIVRCIKNRPLVFLNQNDQSLLRKRGSTFIKRDFTQIGTKSQKEDLTLENYLSYDEMKIAALIGVSSPTQFINNGARDNSGIIDESGNFQKHGVYVGLVGARFEKPGLMEWQDIIITQEQNTPENGYGLNKCDQGLVKLWADFYQTKFPTYHEALGIAIKEHDNPNKSYYMIKTNNGYLIFNIKTYKKRIACVVKQFLLEANKRGLEAEKKVYVHVVGLGLGAWQIDEQQTQWILEVYKDIIKNSDLSEISDIDFSYFNTNLSESELVIKNGDILKNKNQNPIKIHFSQRNPADKLADNNKLLVAMYAWDGNAYPGNEYWQGGLTASGDPAAACCSFIATLQNILVNIFLEDNIVKQVNDLLNQLESLRKSASILSPKQQPKPSHAHTPNTQQPMITTVTAPKKAAPISQSVQLPVAAQPKPPTITQPAPFAAPTPNVTQPTPLVAPTPTPTPKPQPSFISRVAAGLWQTVTGLLSYLRSWLPW